MADGADLVRTTAPKPKPKKLPIDGVVGSDEGIPCLQARRSQYHIVQKLLNPALNNTGATMSRRQLGGSQMLQSRYPLRRAQFLPEYNTIAFPTPDGLEDVFVFMVR